MAEEYPLSAPSGDERTMSTLAHILPIITNFIAPLVIYLIKKDESQFVAENSKEALNFQITLFIGYMIAGFLCATVIGIIIGLPMLLVLWVCSVVFGILGAISSNDGKIYRYPFNIRLIK